MVSISHIHFVFYPVFSSLYRNIIILKLSFRVRTINRIFIQCYIVGAFTRALRDYTVRLFRKYETDDK